MMIPKRATFYLIMVLIVLTTACSTHKSGVDHVTTKSGSDIDRQAGLKIEFDISSELSENVGSQQAFTLTKARYRYDINGETKLQHDTSRSTSLFVPLSAGKHQLTVVEYLQGFLTLGMKNVRRRCTYEFTLEAGSEGSFRTQIRKVSDGSNPGLVVFETIGFDNVKTQKLVSAEAAEDSSESLCKL